jgi:hypothetical protein
MRAVQSTEQAVMVPLTSWGNLTLEAKRAALASRMLARLRPTAADILRALQIKVGNGQKQRAKAETKLEFVHHFHCIVLQTRAMWPLR